MPLGPSEFEGTGPWPFGGLGATRAQDKVRIAYRTGQDPDGVVNLLASPEDWGTGGLRSTIDLILPGGAAALAASPPTYADARITYRGKVV